MLSEIAINVKDDLFGASAYLGTHVFKVSPSWRWKQLDLWRTDFFDRLKHLRGSEALANQLEKLVAGGPPDALTVISGGKVADLIPW